MSSKKKEADSPARRCCVVFLVEHLPCRTVAFYAGTQFANYAGILIMNRYRLS